MATTGVMADLMSLAISDGTRSSSTKNTPDALAGSSSQENDDGDTSDTELSESARDTNPEKMKQAANSIALDNYLQTHKVEVHDKAPILKTVPRITDQDDSTLSARIIDQVRDYQQELFERAKEENIIAVYDLNLCFPAKLTRASLDTGSGKTLIACLLVRYVLDQQEQNRNDDRPRKLVFFLANR